MASWNPAVPPPPVAGAAVGNELADALGVAAGVGVADGLADGLADERALALGVIARAVPLGEVIGLAEPVPPGENGVGVAEGEDPEQAETDTEASMVKAAQPMAVDLARSLIPTMVARIFMGPPDGSGRWLARFPVPAFANRPLKGNRVVGPGVACADQGKVPESASGHKGKARGRRRHAMACSSLGCRLRGKISLGKMGEGWRWGRRSGGG
jgi:hypothetical protein